MEERSRERFGKDIAIRQSTPTLEGHRLRRKPNHNPFPAYHTQASMNLESVSGQPYQSLAILTSTQVPGG